MYKKLMNFKQLSIGFGIIILLIVVLISKMNHSKIMNTMEKVKEVEKEIKFVSKTTKNNPTLELKDISKNLQTSLTEMEIDENVFNNLPKDKNLNVQGFCKKTKICNSDHHLVSKLSPERIKALKKIILQSEMRSIERQYDKLMFSKFRDLEDSELQEYFSNLEIDAHEKNKMIFKFYLLDMREDMNHFYRRLQLLSPEPVSLTLIESIENNLRLKNILEVYYFGQAGHQFTAEQKETIKQTSPELVEILKEDIPNF